MREWEFVIDWIAKEDALEVFRNFDSSRKPIVRFIHDEIGTVESVSYSDGKIVATLRTQFIPAYRWASIELLQNPVKLRTVQFLNRARIDKVVNLDEII